MIVAVISFAASLLVNRIVSGVNFYRRMRAAERARQSDLPSPPHVLMSFAIRMSPAIDLRGFHG